MDRRFGRLRAAAAAVVLAGAMLASGGCLREMLTTAGYLINGTDVPAEFAGLRNKKVVLVCRPLVGLQYRDAGAARDLALQIGKLLVKHDPKIKVVDQQKVLAWADEHAWEDYCQVGRALGADMVIGIDVTAFNLVDGPTLYRGRASLEVKVYDLSKAKDQEVVFEKSLPQAVYPADSIGSVPISEYSEPEFRHRFVLVLADQIGRFFYAHDAYTNPGSDPTGGLY
ncbi:MAG: hypothetical protein ABSG86_22280 [Thermoguttaceae bacterium]|jgi:hypothetical protein